MNGSVNKRLVIINILNGATSFNSPMIERCVLGALAGTKRPELKDPQGLWFFGIPALLVVVTLGLLFREYLENTFVLGAMVLAFVNIFVCVWHFASRRELNISRHAKLLQEPLEELRQVRTLTKTYVENLDRRTSRYFHVVTHSKITAYFVLTRIIETLQERIQEVSELLAEPSKENVLAAHQLLQGTLVFNDSFTGAEGSTHVVALARVKTVVLQMMEHLDSELSVLEREILLAECLPDDSSEDGRLKTH